MPSTAPPMPPGGRVTLRGRGAPWVWDSGPPADPAPTMVLLHGWTSTAALNWSRCFAPLQRLGRVVAIDHRGHGRGIQSLRPFRLEDCADDVAALVERLGTGPVVVVGYSMGGPVAQLVWRRHPGLVAGLVLCATAARFPRPNLPDAALGAVTVGLSMGMATVPAAVRREAYRRLARRRPDFDAMAPWAQAEASRGDPMAFVQAGAALALFESMRWLPSIDVPTASVITTRDRTVAPREQRALAAAIPGARVFEVPADHRACVDDAGLFVPALLAACGHVAGPVAMPVLPQSRPDRR